MLKKIVKLPHKKLRFTKKINTVNQKVKLAKQLRLPSIKEVEKESQTSLNKELDKKFLEEKSVPQAQAPYQGPQSPLSDIKDTIEMNK